MHTRYSNATGAFYPLDIDYPDLPADVREVPIEAYHAAMARPAGSTFDIGADGRCVITEAPAPTLADLVANAIRQIDADVDAIYGAVIGNRQSEYDAAERDAQAYKAAGYGVVAPSCVQSWATAKKWTAKQAADDILATSAAWRAAQADIRANRLARKEDVRAAANPATVDAVLATWAAYVTATRAALGA